MKKRTKLQGGERITAAVLRAIDIWLAILLLTGQLTVGGVFLASGAFWFALQGPIFGNVRSEGKTRSSNLVLNGIDVITALLLILGQLTNTGPWITSGLFNPVVSGPAFGNSAVPVPITSSKTGMKAKEFFDDFAHEIIVREVNKLSNNTIGSTTIRSK